MENIYKKIVSENKSLRDGFVQCGKCKTKLTVDSAKCLRKGWPTCCGQTMNLL